MDFIPMFVTLAAIQIAGWLTPGANLLAIIAASTSVGRRAGVLTALGIAAGVTLWTFLSVAGVAVVFQLMPSAFLALKLAGAVYLLWLGIGALRNAASGGRRLTADRTTASGWAAFRTGFVVLLLNPKAPLFFGSILTAFIPVGAPNWVLAAIVVEYAVLSAALNSTTALVFSTTPVLAWFQRAQGVISAVFGVMFCGLAGLILLELFGAV
ncbi:MAG: hypothetical protein GKR99_02950 [Rhodobacteraceae bacterium]|nr:hypothetical protein [Paracoccaceae bacterium]